MLTILEMRTDLETLNNLLASFPVFSCLLTDITGISAVFV